MQAWGLVEVPRYLFYAINLYTEVCRNFQWTLRYNCGIHQVPYPLKWLRYSLFYVLYPMGITGALASHPRQFNC